MLSRTAAVLVAANLLMPAVAAAGDDAMPVKKGAEAFGGWRDDAPGVRRLITPDALPKPFATRSASRSANIAKPPAGAKPKAPSGFEVSQFASGLSAPRLLRTAPNGDVLVAESDADRISILRTGQNGRAEAQAFAEGLSQPFGIAFYPPGPEPEWVYVANTDSIVRFPYRNGDAKARGRPETVVAKLPTGGHVTRDLAFTSDGKRMLVSVGSESNVAQEMGRKSVEAAKAWDEEHGATGAAWGEEAWRAAVLSFTPEGKDRKLYATGIRNCVGLAVQPQSGDVWCSVNERDGLGDDLVPDYVTRVREGAFYGWPWYYIGDHEEPRLAGQRPDLKGKVTGPDVLLQAHSASLQMAFYDGSAFPPEYRGSAFAAEHGSWNRGTRSGYKVVRILMRDGRPSGEYEDFMTGFVLDDSHVWGRPVGVTVTRDGALLVSDDGNGIIWRVAWAGNRQAEGER